MRYLELEDYMYERAEHLPWKSVINQPATSFIDLDEYTIATYFKTACWLYALQKKLGKPVFDKCIKTYFSRWKFRHPYPEDMRQVFEEVSKQNLSYVFNQLTQPKQSFYLAK